MNRPKRRKYAKIKWVIIKVVSTLSAAEIEYNTVKPSIHFWLLTIHYEPFVASTIASYFSSGGDDTDDHNYSYDFANHFDKIIGWDRMALLFDYNSDTETIRLRNDDVAANH